MPEKLLLVDDEDVARSELKKRFESLGYTVREAYGVKDCERVLQEYTPDLIILDWNVPNKWDGQTLLRKIREMKNKKFAHTLVLIYSIEGDKDETKLVGLDYGVTHCLGKDVSPHVIQRTVTTLLSNFTNESNFFRANTSLQLAIVDEEEFSLSRQPYQLWELLVRFFNKNQPVTDYDIVEYVFEEGTSEDITKAQINRIHTLVKRLREVVEFDSKNPKYIQTRSGLGYILVEPQT